MLLSLIIIAIAIFICCLISTATSLKISKSNQALRYELEKSYQQQNSLIQESITDKFTKLQQQQHEFREKFDEHQLKNLKYLQESIQTNIQGVRQQINESLQQQIQHLSKRVELLTEATENRLRDISSQVEKRLADGFEKTTTVFSDVLKRLALIDSAQQKIADLSNNVVDLQEILVDKRARGAFGEVQLNALIRDVIPEQHLKFQHTLSNSKRADCMLCLPEPSGNVVIDSKFPLESYQNMTDQNKSESERQQAESQFKLDIKKHIQDIADKYIIPGETADSAIMFIPAEAIFAEIHSHYPDLVAKAHQSRVWLTSPTTMMAIITTANAVLKDAATRKQIHIIQEHLHFLSKDFDRFQKRMDNLAKHIQQANNDVELVHTSATKISSRFSKIEKVDLDDSKVEDSVLLE